MVEERHERSVIADQLVLFSDALVVSALTLPKDRQAD
jgi:hypothetical protein